MDGIYLFLHNCKLVLVNLMLLE